jgi:hypothetical protein
MFPGYFVFIISPRAQRAYVRINDEQGLETDLDSLEMERAESSAPKQFLENNHPIDFRTASKIKTR